MSSGDILSSEEYLLPVNEWLMETPYAKVGDRLWVKEKWRATGDGQVLRNGKIVDDPQSRDQVIYAADGHDEGPWRSSMFMPLRLSRIDLEVTSIRAEQLQEITDEDARAEGRSGVGEFRELWDKLHARDGFEWASNPWVFVIGFRVIE